MIRTFAITGALAVALTAMGAQAQPMGPPPMHGPPPGAMAGGMGAMSPPEYVHAAATSDEFEIAEAKMALQRSQNPHVRGFAQRMIRDHTHSTMMIRMAVRRSGHMAPPPPPLMPAQVRMLDDLRNAGPSFDRVYVDQQVHSHEMALAVHQAYAEGGSDPALRHAARMIVPVVQSHLAMARDMQSHMG